MATVADYVKGLVAEYSSYVNNPAFTSKASAVLTELNYWATQTNGVWSPKANVAPNYFSLPPQHVHVNGSLVQQDNTQNVRPASPASQLLVVLNQEQIEYMCDYERLYSLGTESWGASDMAGFPAPETFGIPSYATWKAQYTSSEESIAITSGDWNLFVSKGCVPVVDVWRRTGNILPPGDPGLTPPYVATPFYNPAVVPAGS